jgi:hypothetical protein
MFGYASETMSTHILIVVSDKNTADAIEKGLVARKVLANRLKRDQVLRFGMKLGPMKGTAQEFIEIGEALPDIADAIWDTIERFQDRISIYINQQRVESLGKETVKSRIVHPETFEKMFKRK